MSNPQPQFYERGGELVSTYLASRLKKKKTEGYANWVSACEGARQFLTSGRKTEWDRKNKLRNK